MASTIYSKAGTDAAIAAAVDAIPAPPTGTGGSVTSVNGQTGEVVLDAADVGADPAGTAQGLVDAVELLPGPQGPAGAPGDPGPKGDPGDTGPAGTTTWAGITDKPAIIAAGADKATARAAIDAGTSSLALGTTGTDAAPGNHLHDSRYVRTVNGAGPDGAGDVAVVGGGGAYVQTTITSLEQPIVLPSAEPGGVVTVVVTAGGGTPAWPIGVTWDGGVPPLMAVDAGAMDVVSFLRHGDGWLGFVSGAFPGPPDSTPPTVGTMAASSITASGFTLTVSGASDETALHAAPYAYSTNDGTTWSPWRASAVHAVSGLAAATAYTCRHKVRDAAGNESIGAAISVMTAGGTDATAPTVPTGLSATATSATTVDLAWTASTDAVGVTGYEYRVDSGTPVDAGAGTTETVTGLTADTSYSLQVRAYDAAGNRSDWSTAASATTEAVPADTTEPTVGTMAASAITATGFTLTVSGASDAVGLHAQPYAFTTDGGTTWSAYQASAVFVASGLTAETGYACNWRVRDASGNVSTGTAQTVTTGAPAESAVQFLSAHVDSTDRAAYTFPAVSLGDEAAARTIVVTVATFAGGSDPAVTAVTVGGVSAVIDHTATSSNRRVTVARATVPTGATGDVVVTMAATTGRCMVMLYRASVALTAAYTATNTNQNGAPSLAIQTPAGGAVVAVSTINNATGVTCAWTGATEDAEVETDPGAYSGRAASALAVATGGVVNVAATWTPAAANLYAVLAAVAYEAA